MVLIDNTVLSNFAKVGRTDLIRKVFNRVYVTEQVLEEFMKLVSNPDRFFAEMKSEL